MIDISEKRIELKSINLKIEEIREMMKILDLKKEIEDLLKIQSAEDFYKDLENSKNVNIKLKQKENKLNRYISLEETRDMCSFLLDLLEEDASEATEDEFNKEYKKLISNIEEVELDTLLKGKYDANSAIVTLHSGAGGTEAQDWVEMLYRMFIRYIEGRGFKEEETDIIPGDTAGIKSVTFKVVGENAYGYLKAEKGVHRLVRISPFDSKSRRHTSFASLEVIPEIENDEEIVIRPEDLKVDTYRSSGAGGQHVNKTESAIRITHLPTQIVVQCQNQRSQIQNREKAMKMLINKLAELKDRENEEKNRELKGNLKKIEWGSQIMSYVFCPYTMVKDLRTGYENRNIEDVMNGNIHEFIKAYLKENN